MYQLIIIVHVLLGLGVVSLVLLQQGKGADAGAAFGSGSSGSVFGAQGSSSFLSRTTAILAALFFCTSLGLAVLSGHQDGSVDLMETIEAEEVFADIPLVNDTDDNSAPIKAIPMTPEEVKKGSFVPDTVSNAVKDVSDQASQLSDTVENKAGSLVKDVESAVSDSMGTIENKAGSFIDGAENIVSEGIGAIENKTESLVEGAENAVSNSIEAIENKAGSLIDDAKDRVSENTGIVSDKANRVLEETSGIVSDKLDMIIKE